MRVVLRCLLMACLLSGTIVSAQEAVPPAPDAYTQAQEAYRKGDLRQAATLFEQAAQAEGDRARRAEIKVRLAVTYFNTRNRAKAETALEDALRDAPQLELLRDFYADDFLALFAKVKARLAEPTPPPPTPTPKPQPQRPASAQPGTLASLHQQLAQAIDNPALEVILQEVVAAEGTSPPQDVPQLLELKAEVLERLGRPAEGYEQRGRAMAMRAVSQAFPGSPAIPLDALQEARLLLAQRRSTYAEAILRGVLAVLPTCQEAYALQGEALLESDKLDEAFSHLRTALLGNDKPDLWLLLGEVELRRDHLAAARDAFIRATSLDSRNDRAWAALGLLAARMGDITTARDALDHALQANGTLFEARVVRAQVALADGDVPGALQHLQRALQIRPDDPWATGWLGATLLLSGNPQSAVDKLSGAVREGHLQMSAYLAEALRRQGRLDDALAALDEADQNDPGVRLLRARCLLDRGSTEEAEALLRELLMFRPTSAEGHYLLGIVLHRERDWSGALAELRRAASLRGPAPDIDEAVRRVSTTIEAQKLLDSALAPPRPSVGR